MESGTQPSRLSRAVGASGVLAGLVAAILGSGWIALTVSILWQQSRTLDVPGPYTPAIVILTIVALACVGTALSVLRGIDAMPGGRTVLIISAVAIWIQAFITGFSVGLYLVPSAALATYAAVATGRGGH